MTMKSLLFDPVALGDLRLKNRFLMSAAAAWRATADGDILQEGQDILHFGVARGGTALVINGGVSVHANGQTHAPAAMFDNDRRIPSFRQFARSVKEGGAAAAFQATHGGMWARAYQQSVGGQTFTPSFLVDGPICDYLNPQRQEVPSPEDRILEVIAAYGDAAARAKSAGFDAVEVHAAHESLLAQFLSPITNVRKDRWGGPIENRCRFHGEVLADIRRKAGPGFPVLIKLGVQDGLAGGLRLEDGAAAAAILARQGNVTAIEVSQGLSASMTNFNDTSMKTGITRIEQEGYYRAWARQVKAAVKGTGVLVIMQGGLRSIELMEEVVQNGEADLVSMCRPYIREPALVTRWLGGDRAKARCISCNACLKKVAAGGHRLECALDHPA